MILGEFILKDADTAQFTLQNETGQLTLTDLTGQFTLDFIDLAVAMLFESGDVMLFESGERMIF